MRFRLPLGQKRRSMVISVLSSLAISASSAAGQSRAVEHSDPNIPRPPLITTMTDDSARSQVAGFALARLIQAASMGDGPSLDRDLPLQGGVLPSDSVPSSCGSLRDALPRLRRNQVGPGSTSSSPLFVLQSRDIRDSVALALASNDEDGWHQ